MCIYDIFSYYNALNFEHIFILFKGARIISEQSLVVEGEQRKTGAQLYVRTSTRSDIV